MSSNDRNLIIALQATSAIMTMITEAASAVVRINTVINIARGEGRDVTDDELVIIQTETDEIEASVLGKLRGNG